MKFSCHCFSSLVVYKNCFCIKRICCNIACQNFRKKKRVWRNVSKPYRKWRKVFKIPLALLRLLEKVSRSKYAMLNFLRGFWLHWHGFVLHAVWQVSCTHSLSVSACWFNNWNVVIWFESSWMKSATPEKLQDKSNLSNSCQWERLQNYNTDWMM